MLSFACYGAYYVVYNAIYPSIEDTSNQDTSNQDTSYPLQLYTNTNVPPQLLDFHKILNSFYAYFIRHHSNFSVNNGQEQTNNRDSTAMVEYAPHYIDQVFAKVDMFLNRFFEISLMNLLFLSNTDT